MATEFLERHQGNGSATYDLIILVGDRIALHDHYETPMLRLRRCAEALSTGPLATSVRRHSTAVSDLARTVLGRLASLDAHNDATLADRRLNQLAKDVRIFGVHVYMSTTHKHLLPPVLYTLTTRYETAPDDAVQLNGEVDVEHFLSRESRHDALRERAEAFFDSAGQIPMMVLEDEDKLVGLIMTFLPPVKISLGEAVLDSDAGVYRSGASPKSIVR